MTTPATQTATRSFGAASFASSNGRNISIERLDSPSLLAGTIASNEKAVSGVTTITHSPSPLPSTEGDNSPHGPLPEWAYFYDPALSYAQVKYILSQLKPQEEYNELPHHQRQSVVVNDLQQALSSMRQFYGKSTEVVANTPTKTPEATGPETTARESNTRSGHHSGQESNVENAILVEESGDEFPFRNDHDGGKLARNHSISAMQRDNQVPTSRVPAQIAPDPTSFESKSSFSPRESRGEPVYNVARSSGSHSHGKRLGNGDDSKPKRPRLQSTLEVDQNGRARVVSSPSQISRSAGIVDGPNSFLQAFSADDHMTSTGSGLPAVSRSPNSLLLEQSLPREPSNDDDANYQVAAYETSRSRKWPQEDTARLLKAREDGHTWDVVQQERPTDGLQFQTSLEGGSMVPFTFSPPETTILLCLIYLDCLGFVQFVHAATHSSSPPAWIVTGRYDVTALTLCLGGMPLISVLQRSHRRCLLNDNNDGTFSIKGEQTDGKAHAKVISRNPLDKNEPPMVKTRSYRQVQLEKEEKQASVENPLTQRGGLSERTFTANKHDGVFHGSGDIGKVIIPEDLTMATNIRSYREWPGEQELSISPIKSLCESLFPPSDETGALVTTYGVPLPANYTLAEFRGFEWLCPIRTCGRIVPSLKSLGGHFSSGHPGVLLNDNRDGTFIEVGRRDSGQGKTYHRIVMVTSKNPLPPNPQPRAEPNAPPQNLQAQIDLAASIAEWKKAKLARPVAAKPTMDEMLARRVSSVVQSEKEDTESSELSDEVTPLDSDTPEPQATSAEDSEGGGATEPVHNESDVELPDSPKLTTLFARENWDIIQALFKGKRFPPPQSGPLKKLISLRRVREIARGPGAGKLFYVQWPKDVSLLIVQLVGRESPTACERCSRGFGIFSSCVVVPQDVANLLQNGVCACVSCSWKSLYYKTCDLQKLDKSAEGATIIDSDPPRKSVMEAATRIARVDSMDLSSSRTDQPLSPRRSRRLKSDAMDGSGQEQPNVQARISSVEDVEAPATAASQKMTHTTKVDKSFSFRVDVILPRTTLQLEPDVDSLRICSLALGKVTVKVQGEQRFDIGLQGMFKLVPGVGAEVVNAAGFDAVLQISSFRGR
ncbi:hypothetical protein N0V82_000916 [Gnomoniopsis sp. IMI 355080]|nr:hypothetical protein N0V82_000916 [Gnomoniopsis sp. IMI 355080]